VPSNEQRRATAKRKLERQLERRTKQARRRRILVIAGGSIAAVAVIAAVAIAIINSKHEHKSNTATTTSPAAPTSHLRHGCRGAATAADNCPDSVLSFKSSSATFRSCAVCQRRCGSFRRQRITRCSNSCGSRPA